MHAWPDIQILILIIAANAAPILACRLSGNRCAAPIDRGYLLDNGQPLFGASKTWRGLIAGLIFPAMLAPLIGLDIVIGTITGLLAMSGDLLASFSKRRLGMASESRATGLDQLPESLLPAMATSLWLPMNWLDIATVVAAFTTLEMLTSPLLYRMGIRKHPY
ncbi:MAG TPA: CDP-archaeol synthase [Mariprofundaceae bacterium]|nr:CDP-archaeol synthase [Mariprofundaceae bacterium]